MELTLQKKLGDSTISKGYSYDDLLLAPQYSELLSREDVDISVVLDQWIHLKVPIISAPMDTITDTNFAVWMAKHGGMGIIHRYQSPSNQRGSLKDWHTRVATWYGFDSPKIAVSVGSSEEHESRVDILLTGQPDCIAVDVAHGDSYRALKIIEYIRKKDPGMVIISGNIATPEAAKRSATAGADIFRVGLGAGSVCTTRLVGGVGVPQLTAISGISSAISGYPIIADGGIRSSGDIVKALAAGADAVIIGGLLANYSETPGLIYRGMASKDALFEYKGTVGTVEGTSTEKRRLTEQETEAEWSQLVGGIKQGFAYLGAKNIAELRERSEWIEVSTRGYNEGTPHGVREE